jgi:ABC-type Zn uptake system ZnuABC Zn-binding protein ZnuA
MRLSRSRPRIWVLAGLAAAAIVLTACVPARAAIGPSAAPDALRVTATTTVLADIVKSVGGTRTSVQSIVPPGAGPEDYEPRPADARAIADAQVLVSNGVGLDTFVDRLIRSAGGDDAPRLVLGDGIPAIEVNGEPNPHFWLDPTIVRDAWLPKIVDALSAAAPGDRATFEANAAVYAQELTALDAELAARVATIPPANRKLVTFHDAFPYFARHYGFDLVGVVVANAGQEPTAADLATLVNEVRETQVPAVFAEAQFNPKFVQTLADEAGIHKVVTTLYNDALGPAPADTYPGMMRWNMQQIVDALR